MITKLSPDESLELDIETARRLILAGPTPEIRSLACKLFRALIESRSPERQRKMAVDRGLPTA